MRSTCLDLSRGVEVVYSHVFPIYPIYRGSSGEQKLSKLHGRKFKPWKGVWHEVAPLNTVKRYPTIKKLSHCEGVKKLRLDFLAEIN